MITPTALEKAIIQTVVYYDLFEFPLTAREVHQYLIGQQASAQTVATVLKQLAKKHLEQCETFYCLPGRSAIITKRKQRYLIAEKKWNIAMKNAKILRHLPGVEAIFITNTLAFSNAKDRSDIDLLVITKENRIWTTRFWCAGLMKILKRRPTPKNKKDTICLSLYQTKNDLSLKAYAYKNDMHFTQWVSQMVPLYDPHSLFPQFMKENQWAWKQRPNAIPYEPTPRRQITFAPLRKLLLLPLLFLPESLLKRYQNKILPKVLKEKAKDSSPDVILSDTILKLHTRDKRQEINFMWQQACKRHVPQFNPESLYQLIGQLLR